MTVFAALILALVFPRTFTTSVDVPIDSSAQGSSFTLGTAYSSSVPILGNYSGRTLEVTGAFASLNSTQALPNMTVYFPFEMNNLTQFRVYAIRSAIFFVNLPRPVGNEGLSSVELDFSVNHVSIEGTVQLLWFVANATAPQPAPYVVQKSETNFLAGFGGTAIIKNPGHYTLNADLGNIGQLFPQLLMLAIEPSSAIPLALEPVGSSGGGFQSTISISVLSLKSSEPPKVTLFFKMSVYPAGLENQWPWGLYALATFISIFRDDELTETLYLTVLSVSASWAIWIMMDFLVGEPTATRFSVIVGLILICSNLEQRHKVFSIPITAVRDKFRKHQNG